MDEKEYLISEIDARGLSDKEGTLAALFAIVDVLVEKRITTYEEVAVSFKKRVQDAIDDKE